MAKKDTFLGFHKSIAYVYQILGVAPVPYKEDSRITRTLAAVSCLIVLIFWIGVGFAFGRKRLPGNAVSVISNYIQLLLNVTAFSVALVNPLWKYQDYQEIIKLFNQIDQQLEEVTTLISYRKHTKVFYIVTSTFLALLSSNQGLSFYVYIIRNDNSVSYWILASIPLLFYAMSVHQAIVIIFCIHKRLQLVSELLLTQKETDIVQVQCQICVGKCLELEDKEVAGRFFHLIHDIYLLCGKVDDYFGPVLLTSMGALFGMASIQAFYCYTVIEDDDDFTTYYMWSLFCSVHLLVINLLLVVSLSCISELVTKDSNTILSYIMRAQQNNLFAAFDAWSWLPSMLSRIGISAFGFFHVNCKMLFGFFSALITYLIILIQFNSMATSTRSPILAIMG